MKIFYSISVLAIVVGLWSCQKESVKPENVTSVTSQFKQTAKFNKELVIEDESGKNQALYLISSDDSLLLTNYVKNNNMYLIIEKLPANEPAKLKSENLDTSKLDNYNLNESAKIFVDLLSYKLEDNVESFCLAYKKTSLKSFTGFGYPVGYSNGSGFIGVVHCGWGDEFYAKASYYTSWFDMQFGSTTTKWGTFIYPQSFYWGFIDLGQYKQYITVWPDYKQTYVNWRIAYNRTDFRGQNCTIGWYDGMNCAVAAAPSGTTAFIYSTGGNSYFYYTPLPGNQCPIGNGFDGLNCQYSKIPTNCSPFIYSNTFYVKPDIIVP